MIKHFCDFCGKEMDEKKSFVIEIAGADNLLDTIKKEACETCGEILIAGSLHFGLAKEKRGEEQENFWDTHDPSGGDLPPEDDEDNLSGDTEEKSQKQRNLIRQQDKRQKRAVNVDHGKICALRKAGWPVKEICSEMHISAATVFKHLKMEKQNEKN